MNRRTARLRKEYLYRKSLEGKAREEYEKKKAIRAALEEGKPIPTELRGESQALKKDIDLEDDNTAVPRSHIDDEYSKLGVEDPTVRAHSVEILTKGDVLCVCPQRMQPWSCRETAGPARPEIAIS